MNEEELKTIIHDAANALENFKNTRRYVMNSEYGHKILQRIINKLRKVETEQ